MKPFGQSFLGDSDFYRDFDDSVEPIGGGLLDIDSLVEEDKEEMKKREAAKKKDPRPCWDDYFLKIAHVVAERSNCCRRKVGAVIVKDNHIVSTGYNGTPYHTTNCFDGGCPRCSSEHKTGEKLDECLCVHAEQNAICQAARLGNAIDGSYIYITCSPCLTCLKLLINSGIRRVIFSELYRPYNEQEKDLIFQSGILLLTPDEKGTLRAPVAPLIC